MRTPPRAKLADDVLGYERKLVSMLYLRVFSLSLSPCFLLIPIPMAGQLLHP